ncbi:Inositol 2-dehydrogenase/D-chiro-inositol 3-dehydrogenase [Anatilimnocola aggregata]|uniref:Inositol 2-dehydrogenase/D-chiro-inositol 3-dehydrogenase n=1 Tax=Anatilimnocola aggregata TaxID=2528021 RepID=A0A517YJY2_9BACT|nr:Gfo/Idh/MocA family oxidoreductase [Anatilimnocola aggregata]QDU30534.1 Inositol 2-dehydrogenase/D-chiro-inositol 3-dehydrogenase [Anatilimnocola aggregata]
MNSRREWLAGAGLAGAGLLAASTPAKIAAAKEQAAAGKVFRIGVISASIEGKTQRTNGHTWHFCHPFHPEVNQDVIKKTLDPGSTRIFAEYFRNPKLNFGLMPFPNTRLTHVYDADRASAELFASAYPGVQVVDSVEKMVPEVDAVWLGDASGTGSDHFDLIAPALEKGLPSFVDKPIGKTVKGTRQILELAKKHNAKLMSSSLFRHQWGTAEGLRLKETKDIGPLQFVQACQAGGWTLPSWFIYGQHPVWMVETLCGPGVESVSMLAKENACHAMLTYADRMPAEVWYGRPDIVGLYCETKVHFPKKTHTWTPAIDGNYWLGHSYQMMNMANAFRGMLETGVEPVPHNEILEVTAIIHAAAKSLNEKSRLVDLAEVME